MTDARTIAFYDTRAQDALTDMLSAAGLAANSVRTGVDKGLAGTDDPFIVIQARKDADA